VDASSGMPSAAAEATRSSQRRYTAESGSGRTKRDSRKAPASRSGMRSAADEGEFELAEAKRVAHLVEARGELGERRLAGRLEVRDRRDAHVEQAAADELQASRVLVVEEGHEAAQGGLVQAHEPIV
jgi:hypothetical protein